jgi:hypothetical protein
MSRGRMDRPSMEKTRGAGSATDRGSALVWALFFVALTTGLLLSHSWEMKASRVDTDVRYRQIEHARSFAQAGLTEATVWLRRQAVQPVLAFAPQLDPAATPPILDTIDPALGLVREFEVRGGLWGRYEVRTSEVEDVSAVYGLPAGVVWDIAARGILFERLDPAKAFDAWPNRAIAMQSLRTEVRGVPVSAPANAAVIVNDPRKLLVLQDANITGGEGNPAVAYADAMPALPALPFPIDVTATVSGVPDTLRVPNLDLGTKALFSLRPERLEHFADVVMQDGPWQLRTPVRDQLVYATGSVKVGPRRPLRGSGVIVVNGSFGVIGETNSDFSGLIVVRDDAELQGPFTFRGILIVGNELRVGGTAGGVTLEYDAAAMNLAAGALARYRRSRETRPSGGDGTYTSVEAMAQKVASNSIEAYR